MGFETDSYLYDQIHRLKTMDRGTLNGTHTGLINTTFGQCWTLDETGNWREFREDDTGDGTWDLVQARTANPVNEITDITESAGPSWFASGYNRAGNMTTMPQPLALTSSYSATYDAWNRLVKLAAGADTVSEYAYDGVKRRIVQKSYVAGSLSETRHYYLTAGWQTIEERLGTSPDSADAERQFVWGQRYIDDCVLRDRDTNNNGTLDERLYALQDANWNVTGLINTTGSVEERMAYTAYGVPLFLTSAFVPTTNSYDWDNLYCGYRYEAATGLFHVRHRILHPALGNWVQRDPIGYADGMSLYEYAINRSLILTDPFGEFTGVFGGGAIGLIGGGSSGAGLVAVSGWIPVVGIAIIGTVLIFGILYFVTQPVDVLPCEVATAEAVKNEEKCPPCPDPPKPIVRFDRVPPSRKHEPCPGNHTNIIYWIVIQNPYPDCKCIYDSKNWVTCH